MLEKIIDGETTTIEYLVELRLYSPYDEVTPLIVEYQKIRGYGYSKNFALLTLTSKYKGNEPKYGLSE